MEDDVFVIGHRHPDTDSVCSAIALAHLKHALGDARVRAARAGELNPETRYVLERFGLPAPDLLTEGRGRQLILVDHNEVAQALHDVRDATILEVWEHHRIGDLDIPRPIVFHCEPVGATATLIAEQFLVNDVALPPAIAAALLCAILSDTLVFASPTCSDKDRRMARRLEAIAGVDAVTLGRELMEARGDLAARSASDIIEADFKEFDLAGHQVGIAQVEAPDVSRILARRPSSSSNCAACATRGVCCRRFCWSPTSAGRAATSGSRAIGARCWSRRSASRSSTTGCTSTGACRGRSRWCPRSSRPLLARGSLWGEGDSAGRWRRRSLDERDDAVQAPVLYLGVVAHVVDVARVALAGVRLREHLGGLRGIEPLHRTREVLEVAHDERVVCRGRARGELARPRRSSS